MKKISKSKLCIPIIFAVVGVIVLYIALKPVIDIVIAKSSLVVADEIPKYSKNLNSVFKEYKENEKEQPKEISESLIKQPSYGDYYAQISCDRIKLNQHVYMGDSMDILRVGVGQYEKSYLPGYGRQILLAGHNTTCFAPLKYIKEGDIVKIKTSYGIYRYKVYNTKVVSKEYYSSACEEKKGKEELIMYTCYPFDFLTSEKNQRLFVYADKISGPEVICDRNE